MAEPVELLPLQLDALHERDLDALWGDEPLSSDGSRRVFVRLRPLELVERLAWGANDDRHAVGLIADESDGGGHLVRALLLRPSADPIPTDQHSVLDEMEASRRLHIPAASLSLRWGKSEAGSVA